MKTSRVATLATTSPSAEHAALAALFLGAVAIGLSPIFVRLSELGPTATAFWRLGLALPAFFVWLAVDWRTDAETAPRSPTTGDWWLMVVAGLFFAGDLAFWHWSIMLTSVANATLFANFAPIFVTLGAFLLLGERFRPAFLGALALAIAGAAVLMGDSLSISRQHLLGDAFAIVTAMFYGAYMLAVARLRVVFSTAVIMTWSGVVTTAALYPVALVSGEGLVAPTLWGWVILLALALVSHAGGQSLIAYAFAHLSVAFSSVALLLQPVAAAVFAWVILSEPVGLRQAFGGAVVLIAVWLARRASKA